jgi:hypothetical protein
VKGIGTDTCHDTNGHYHEESGGAKMRRNFQWNGALAIFLVLVLTGFSDEGWAADNYPTKPISVVIGYQPGSTDVSLRLFTESAAKGLFLIDAFDTP